MKIFHSQITVQKVKMFTLLMFGALFIFLSTNSSSKVNSASLSHMTVQPMASKTATSTPTPTVGKSIPKTFTLGSDSQSEYGEVAFNHDNHSFQKYSPDGNSVVGCTECHHTDQAKSALKLPDVTSERDVTLTFEVWKSSSQKVSNCKACHFQDGNVPEGKTMPQIKVEAKTKELDNQIAFHINCNTCHDAAYKLRKELKSKLGFATSKDCAVCHRTN